MRAVLRGLRGSFQKGPSQSRRDSSSPWSSREEGPPDIPSPAPAGSLQPTLSPGHTGARGRGGRGAPSLSPSPLRQRLQTLLPPPAFGRSVLCPRPRGRAGELVPLRTLGIALPNLVLLGGAWLSFTGL